jgi:polyferredoxin
LNTQVIAPTEAQVWLRRALVVGYLGMVALGLFTEVLPRVFWTMLLPLLPIGVVLMGFANWRRICPLAYFGDLGRTLNRGEQRRVPAWMERYFFLATFAGLLVMLVVRLVATNGDGGLLAILLVALAIAAMATNLVLTGKTWCNFICPVGLVERIYTEPNSLLRSERNSQCVRCTACKKYCPDIDQENGYWRDVAGGARRSATYAFPGLVLAFYTYYWLRHGSWEAYFDGRWTSHPWTRDLFVGSGFFFAPGVPAVVAATLTLVLFSLASLLVFLLVERVIGRYVDDLERRRHLTLSLAAFSAFTSFYFFAGAPALRRLTGGTRVAAFVAPLIATLFLVRKWRRRREHYIRDKGAQKLLRNWPFEEPPPEDPNEVFAVMKAGEHARELQLVAYSNTVREMIAEGLVRGEELRLLEEMRKQLGVSRREHEKIIARLSEEDRELFTEPNAAGAEQRVQMAGYETALSEALLRSPSKQELGELRQAFGVSEKAHDHLLERIQGEGGVLAERASGQLHRAREIAADVATLRAGGSDARRFLAYLLRRMQDHAVERVLEYLAIAGDSARIEGVKTSLFGHDLEAREDALALLKDACPGQVDLIGKLAPLILDDDGAAKPAGDTDLRQVLERQVAAPDPYLRAATVWAAANEWGAEAGPMIAPALTDKHELVRDTAVHAARHILQLAEAALENGPEADREAATISVESSSELSLEALFGAVRPAGNGDFSSLATIERMQFLRRVPLFVGLDPEDLHDLSLLTEEASFAVDEALCEEGDVEADDLFILVEGSASVSVRAGKEGAVAEREISVLGVGEVVGDLAFLDGSPRSATVRARKGPVRALRIPGQIFRARLLHRPRVTGPLLTTMAQRIRHLSQVAASGGD